MKKILGEVIKSELIKKTIQFLEDNKKTVLSFVITIIFADILFLKKSSDLMFFGILIFYIIFINIFHLKSRSTFLISLTLLIMMFVSYLFTETSISTSTEKAAVWLVLFLIVGVIQQWRE